MLNLVASANAEIIGKKWWKEKRERRKIKWTAMKSRRKKKGEGGNRKIEAEEKKSWGEVEIMQGSFSAL